MYIFQLLKIPRLSFRYIKNRKISFLETLDLHDFPKLINDPIQHNLSWPTIPIKLLSDIPKFDGKQGGDPQN